MGSSSGLKGSSSILLEAYRWDSEGCGFTSSTSKLSLRCLYKRRGTANYSLPWRINKPIFFRTFFIQVWWQDASLFVYFSYFFYNIHTFIQSDSHSNNTFIRRHSLMPLSKTSDEELERGINKIGLLCCFIGRLRIRRIRIGIKGMRTEPTQHCSPSPL